MWKLIGCIAAAVTVAVIGGYIKKSVEESNKGKSEVNTDEATA